MSKHTPGPWSVSFQRHDEINVTVAYIKDNSDGQRELFRAQSYNEEGTQLQPCLEVMENAILISRAPDMHDALRAVMNTPHFHDMPDEVQAQVLAALGEKTSHTAADFDSGDADPYTARP